MKVDRPIRVNASREDDPPGGEWEALDTFARGYVSLLEVEDRSAQAVAVLAEIERLRAPSDVLEALHRGLLDHRRSHIVHAAVAVLAEIERLRGLDPKPDWIVGMPRFPMQESSNGGACVFESSVSPMGNQSSAPIPATRYLE